MKGHVFSARHPVPRERQQNACLTALRLPILRSICHKLQKAEQDSCHIGHTRPGGYEYLPPLATAWNAGRSIYNGLDCRWYWGKSTKQFTLFIRLGHIERKTGPYRRWVLTLGTSFSSVPPLWSSASWKNSGEHCSSKVPPEEGYHDRRTSHDTPNSAHDSRCFFVYESNLHSI